MLQSLFHELETQCVEQNREWSLPSGSSCSRRGKVTEINSNVLKLISGSIKGSGEKLQRRVRGSRDIKGWPLR
jgi:hypothetical protein